MSKIFCVEDRQQADHRHGALLVDSSYLWLDDRRPEQRIWAVAVQDSI